MWTFFGLKYFPLNVDPDPDAYEVKPCDEPCSRLTCSVFITVFFTKSFNFSFFHFTPKFNVLHESRQAGMRSR